MSQVASRTPIFAALVFELPPESYPAVRFSDRLDLHYDGLPEPVVPEVLAIEPTAVHDPPRLAIEAVVQSRPRGRRAVAVQ